MLDFNTFFCLAGSEDCNVRSCLMISVGVNANGRKHLKKKLTELSLCVSASEVLKKQCSRSLTLPK